MYLFDEAGYSVGESAVMGEWFSVKVGWLRRTWWEMQSKGLFKKMYDLDYQGLKSTNLGVAYTLFSVNTFWDSGNLNFTKRNPQIT